MAFGSSPAAMEQPEMVNGTMAVSHRGRIVNILCSRALIVFALCATAAPSEAAEWVRAGTNTNQPVWGLRGGLQFAIPPGGFTWDDGGPRGLIRIGYPTLPENRYDLINFIAVEPVVNKRRGFSELETSALDGKQGKRFWASESAARTNTSAALRPGRISSPRPGVEELTVLLFVEEFANGAHVRLLLSQRSDAPDELRFTVHAEPDSAQLDACILTATMGNKARTRLLWLNDATVSSLDLYRDYRGPGFAEHQFFPLARLPRTANGDVLVAITNDEKNPAETTSGLSRFWQYHGEKVTQYWRKPAVEISPGLRCAVNGRFQYWMSRTPVPGGVAYENFELNETFRDGQQFIFGVTRRSPADLLK
jgi:hypothetical protein